MVKEKTNRLTRDDELKGALTLCGAGIDNVKVAPLAEHLGVTTGSFYWHSKNRAGFFRQLTEYWDEYFTQTVIAEISTKDTTPEERLLELMHLVHTKRLDRFEMPVRAWAQQTPVLAPLVRSVDKRRIGFVRSLFMEMGFDEDDAEMRTRVFLSYMITQRL